MEDSTSDLLELLANKECHCKRVGYQMQCSYLWGISAERLLKLERNDSGVAGLILDGTGWVEGSGRVFGDNKSLNRIQIYDAKKD